VDEPLDDAEGLGTTSTARIAGPFRSTPGWNRMSRELRFTFT